MAASLAPVVPLARPAVNARLTGRVAAVDNSVHFHLDGHEVDEATFLGHLPFPIVQAIKPKLPPAPPRPSREEQVRFRLCAEIARGHRLFTEAQTIADIDTAYRIARNVQWMLTTSECQAVPPLYTEKLGELVDAADEFERQQRAEIMLGVWTRVGILLVLCFLFIPIASALAPPAYRPHIVMSGIAVGLAGAAAIALKGVR